MLLQYCSKQQQNGNSSLVTVLPTLKNSQK
jgi:hypothetical protein